VENPEILGNALIRAFVELDAQLRKHQMRTINDAKPDMSGCTAVCALVTKKYIICANAGDSRCVLGTNGVARPMSFDHKPHSASERKRIEDAGGTVQWKRVDGDLAVSRAFGDFQFKARSDLDTHQQKVSCWPDVEVYDRSPEEDDVLVLACDGVWDVLSNEAAIDTVRQILLMGEKAPDLIAEELVDTALNLGTEVCVCKTLPLLAILFILRLGSMDNISAIVARFPAAKLGDPSLGGVAALRKARAEGYAQTAEGGAVGTKPPPIKGDMIGNGGL
jgi:serine/threonine protein phosphatase PrpC